MLCKHLKLAQELIKDSFSSENRYKFKVSVLVFFFALAFRSILVNDAGEMFAFHESLVFLFTYSFDCFRFLFVHYYPEKLSLS